MSGARALPAATPVHEDGVTRSARLMRALGPDAAPIWAQLDPVEAQRLTAAMDQVGTDLDQEAVALGRFLSSHDTRAPAVPTSAGGVWETLSAMDTSGLKALIGSESPQTLAYILSRLSGHAAARLLRSLPPAVSIDAMRRMLRLGPCHASAIEAMETTLAGLLSDGTVGAQSGGHQGVARIFDHLDTRLEQAFLAALDKSEPGAGKKVRQFMFTFDDLAGLGPAGLQTMLSRADRAVLVHALKGAAPQTADAFFNNMTQRASNLLKEEISGLGPMRRSEVEAARAELVALARALIVSGDILPGDAHEDDELVE